MVEYVPAGQLVQAEELNNPAKGHSLRLCSDI